MSWTDQRIPAPAETAVRRIETDRRLDSVIKDVSGLVERVLPTGVARDALHGVWLGHPLHPLLTDLPIGAWTSATIVDFVGGRRGARAAQLLVGFGCLSAIPTALAGAADWSRSDRRRPTGRARPRGVELGRAGALRVVVERAPQGSARAAASSSVSAAPRPRRCGGYLGGHLVYRRSVGANRTAGDRAAQRLDRRGRVVVDARDAASSRGRRRRDPDRRGAHDRHLGPLQSRGRSARRRASSSAAEPTAVSCVPWHGSTFRVDDGAVVHGPATSPQPAYDVRRDGRSLAGSRTNALGRADRRGSHLA